MKKICLERREGAEVNPDDGSDCECDCPEESVEEVNSPSTSKGRARGTGVGEKCNALEVWLWLGVRTTNA